jgi:hypothetical protein
MLLPWTFGPFDFGPLYPFFLPLSALARMTLNPLMAALSGCAFFVGSQIKIKAISEKTLKYFQCFVLVLLMLSSIFPPALSYAVLLYERTMISSGRAAAGIQKFSVDDYQEELSDYNSKRDSNGVILEFGPISNATEAMKCAGQAYAMMKHTAIPTEADSVFFDSENKSWLVAYAAKSSGGSDKQSGVLLEAEQGRILAVW